MTVNHQFLIKNDLYEGKILQELIFLVADIFLTCIKLR